MIGARDNYSYSSVLMLGILCIIFDKNATVDYSRDHPTMTKPLYHTDTYLFEADAIVCSVVRGEANKVVVSLNQTIFYPQGGGQPSDIGSICNPQTGDVLVSISMVRMDSSTGIVLHEGIMQSEGVILEPGMSVKLKINSETRILHSRIHSAGHLMDHALQLLEVPFKGTKGYHFPSGPYVEYECQDPNYDLSPNALNDLKVRLEGKCQEMITQGLAITTTTSKPSDLSSDVRSELSEKALASEWVRLIHFETAPIPGPCGGTHLKNTAEIKSLHIKKISLKNGIIRISYICD